MSNISIEIIDQLNDNYSYLIFSNYSSSGIVIDPAEHNKILPIIKKKKLKIDHIFITHHHNDHTSGVLGLLKEYPKAQIHSPSKLFSIEIKNISDGDIIKTSLNEFQVLSTPGHTLDHIVLLDKENNFLFAGDVLFRLGCGRVFEGSIEQMHNSLNKLLDLSDEISVYCGHEYTLNNIKFLKHIFLKNSNLEDVHKQIMEDLTIKKRTIPFKLGNEKKFNPFLNPACEIASELKKKNNYSNLDIFRYLREKKDKF